MPLDTVKLRSPPLSEEVFSEIERICVRRQAVQLATGAMLYEITSGSLRASWDSRISVRSMREDWIKDQYGRVRLQPSAPYVILECSTAKVFYGQNVYGGPTNFQDTCTSAIALVAKLIAIDLPSAERWQVRRADWAESFSLTYAAIQEFFEITQSTYFPRRKMQKYGDHAIYIPGRTTTVKLYHKGPEFAAHDRKRITQALVASAGARAPAPSFELREVFARRKASALQRLANKRLRVEVEVHADKLDFDFGRKPFVNEITDAYLTSVFDYEMGRFLREGQASITLARTNREVALRLRELYGPTAGNRLHGFWCRLATCGENVCRRDYSSATFYRNRKCLQEAGVSWHNTDVQVIVTRDALPHDFAPTRTDRRRCVSRVRANNVALSSRSFELLALSCMRARRLDGNRADSCCRQMGNDRSSYWRDTPGR